MNAVSPKNLPEIVIGNQRVITTQLLAQCYEVDPVRIRKNFTRNSQRFIEGTHYFKLEGDELRVYKETMRVSGHDGYDAEMSNKFQRMGLNFEIHRVPERYSVEIDNNVNSLMLWTEKGAARHSKILDTDKAWDMFDMLEEGYFHPERKGIPRELQQQIAHLQTELLKKSPRMHDVLKLTRCGYSKKAQAKMLGIGETTVRVETKKLKECGYPVESAGTQIDLFGKEGAQ